METLFENRYTRDRSVFEEFFGYSYFKTPYAIVCYAVLAICLVLSLTFFTANPYYVAIVALWDIVFFGTRVFFYNSQVNAALKQDREMHGPNVDVEIVVTEEGIRTGFPDSNSAMLEFKNVSKVIKTKNLILVRSKAGIVHLFPKDSFTKGTAEEFLEYLKSRGIKA